jgi:hypothetical protein
LIGGALRFDGDTFRRSAAADGLTRLHLAVVLLSAISIGFATAIGALAGGVVKETEPALYRAVVVCWALAVVIHFGIFVALAWLAQLVLSFRSLTRLLALSSAPACLSVLIAMVGYAPPSNAVMALVASRLGPTAFFWVGTVLGYYPDDLTLVLGALSLAIAIVALRVGGRVSWPVAVAIVLIAARLVGPLPEIADLVMNGIR